MVKQGKSNPRHIRTIYGPDDYRLLRDVKKIKMIWTGDPVHILDNVLHIFCFDKRITL